MSRPSFPIWLRRALGVTGAVTAAAASFVGVLPPLLSIPAIGLLLTFAMRPARDGEFVRVSVRNAVVVGCIALGLIAIVAQPLALGWYYALFGYDLGLWLALITIAVLVLPMVAVDAPTGSALRVTRRGLGVCVTVAMTVVTVFASSGQSFVAIAALTVLVPIVGVVSLLRRRGAGRSNRGRRVIGGTVGAVVAILLIGVLALGTFAPLAKELGSVGYGIASAVYLAGALGIAALGFAPAARRDDRGLVLAVLATVFLGAQVTAAVVPPVQPTELASPLRDETFVVHGGRAELVNYHYTVSAQRDAIDLVQLQDGVSHPAGSTDLDDYAIFNKPVLATAAGIVTEAADGFADSPIGIADPANPTGNHIVVDIGAGRFVMYAHLRQGSIIVEAGDVVAVGDELGRVGNSGNTTEPHLHIQVQNQPTVGGDPDVAAMLLSARTYPIRFTEVLVGDAVESRSLDPRRGDSFRPSP